MPERHSPCPPSCCRPPLCGPGHTGLGELQQQPQCMHQQQLQPAPTPLYRCPGQAPPPHCLQVNKKGAHMHQGMCTRVSCLYYPCTSVSCLYYISYTCKKTPTHIVFTVVFTQGRLITGKTDHRSEVGLSARRSAPDSMNARHIKCCCGTHSLETTFEGSQRCSSLER